MEFFDDNEMEPISVLLVAAVKQILKKPDPIELVRWLEQAGPGLAPDLFPATAPAHELHQIASLLGRQIWNATPLPDNQYRARTLSKPERNDPCVCGSGRKYKQCCANVERALPGLPADGLLTVVLDELSLKALAEFPRKRFSLELLAEVAADWGLRGDPKRAVVLLEPLFEDASDLDERAEFAFDVLADAYMDLDKPKKSLALVERVMAQASNVWLRSAAMHRKITKLADAGDFAEAWLLFREAQRLQPDNPGLSHLEVLLLICEGRRDEAIARSEFWIARLRRLGGYDDIVERLQDMVVHIDETIAALAPADQGIDTLTALVALLPAPACHYRLQPEAQLKDAGELMADDELAALDMAWPSYFTGKQNDLSGEDRVLAALDAASSWLAWLAANPLAWQSLRVLEDITMFAEYVKEDFPALDEQVLRPLYLQAEQVLRAVIGQHGAEGYRLQWNWSENRPALRMLQSRALRLLALEYNPAESIALLRWMLDVLNPDDQQGIRLLLSQVYLATGQPEASLALIPSPEKEGGDIQYNCVLALFMLGRVKQAQTQLRRAATAYPEILAFLAADKSRRPRESAAGAEPGSKEEAWRYRQVHRQLWADVGALDLVRALKSGK